jgi:hypothetical protein
MPNIQIVCSIITSCFTDQLLDAELRKRNSYRNIPQCSEKILFVLHGDHIDPFDAKPCTDVYSQLISHKYKLISSGFEH